MKKIGKKRILFLSWKDIQHPSAGGAELLTDALASHLAKSNDVTYFTSSFSGALGTEKIHGYTIIRKGNIYTTYIHACIWWHWNKIYRKKYSCIIDQVHGIPFFPLLYVLHPPVITLVMEVAGDLWDIYPSALIAMIGKILERIWLLLYRSHPIVTVSESTKNDLIKNAIAPDTISLIPMFSEVQNASIPKKDTIPTLLVIGRIAPVKRIEDAVEAYKIACATISPLKLVIIGKTEPMYQEYTSNLLKKISNDPGITVIENATEEDKKMWLIRAHILLVPSKKEGYGLVILEAAACGTPAIGYSVSGVQDAIINQKTGILVSDNQPLALAKSICEILGNTARYTDMQRVAFAHALSHTKQRTESVFEDILLNHI